MKDETRNQEEEVPEDVDVHHDESRENAFDPETAKRLSGESEEE